MYYYKYYYECQIIVVDENFFIRLKSMLNSIWFIQLIVDMLWNGNCTTNHFNSPVSQLFVPLAVSSGTTYINRTTTCRLYSNISQILLIYKVWGNYNKFASNEIIGGILPTCQNVTVRVCGAWIRIYYVYVQKYIAHLMAYSGTLLVCDGPLGVPSFVKLAYCNY